MTTERDVFIVMRPLLEAERRAGLEQGLAVALKIRDWLTRTPDTAWQAQVREWADKAIEKARNHDH